MCDTFVALPSVTPDGSVLFGKNSDREPNEAQGLEYHPAESYPEGKTLACTYKELPQARETNAVLLCRPFWMWGAEMGANEKGVVIGNEAVWTRMPVIKEAGLTGMDLLRLALERAGSAIEALETMTQILSEHGQGGVCGYEDRRMAYHNSFIIADPREAWVLETAGPLWAALKVKAFYAISNGLSIGEEFDMSHPQLLATARKKGWWKKGETFHFAKCFSDWFYTTFSASRHRQGRCRSLLARKKRKMDLFSAIGILRDHQEDHYSPHKHLLGTRLCAHAANGLTRNATQSTGSLIAHLKPDLQTYWATGTSAPCTGIFKPIRFHGDTLPDLGPSPGGRFNPDNLWWHHERLHRSVLLDFSTRLEIFRPERDLLENSFIKKALDHRPHDPWVLTRQAFQQAREATEKWTRQVQERPLQNRAGWLYRHYWIKQNKKAQIIVC